MAREHTRTRARPARSRAEEGAARRRDRRRGGLRRVHASARRLRHRSDDVGTGVRARSQAPRRPGSRGARRARPRSGQGTGVRARARRAGRRLRAPARGCGVRRPRTRPARVR